VLSKPLRPGDQCDQAGCDGKLRVYSTHVNHILGKRRRYMCCDKCGHKPDRNIWVVPLEHAPPRR